MLTDYDAENRLEYALKHVDWPLQKWRRTVFLDEKTFSSEKDGEYEHRLLLHLALTSFLNRFSE